MANVTDAAEQHRRGETQNSARWEAEQTRSGRHTSRAGRCGLRQVKYGSGRANHQRDKLVAVSILGQQVAYLFAAAHAMMRSEVAKTSCKLWLMMVTIRHLPDRVTQIGNPDVQAIIHLFGPRQHGAAVNLFEEVQQPPCRFVAEEDVDRCILAQSARKPRRLAALPRCACAKIGYD